MAEEATASVQINTDSNAATTSTRQRKKRKWDQPAEFVLSAAASTPNLLPSLPGIALPGVFPLVGVYSTVSSTTSVQIPSIVPNVQHNAVAIVQKINQDLATKGLLPQTKIQDELIAREIVINDAEPNVRSKLTKRQTQEEIQSKTGAVVITRGKYKPPNGIADQEKPLYLHISAGVHLKDTADRIRAVDQAAALVEEMLKQGRQTSGASSLTTVVFVDFEAGSHLDLVNRIRGPNDQFINHIMNETGALVLVKGGSCETLSNEDIPQPLHLLISADNAKSLDDARGLAVHLLETIRSEFIGSRPPHFPPLMSCNLQPSLQVGGNLEQGSVPIVPSSSAFAIPILPTIDTSVDRLGSIKNYSAVPPPRQLLADGERTLVGSDTLPVGQQPKPDIEAFSVTPLPYTAMSTPPYTTGSVQIYPQQSYGIYPQASGVGYSAYTGLYPQASPLQQVALALQRPPVNQSSVQSSSLPLQSESYTKPLTSIMTCQLEKQEKQEKQRRKFQELPAVRKEPSTVQAVSMDMKEQRSYKQQDMPPPLTVPSAPSSSMPPPPPRPRSPTHSFTPINTSACNSSTSKAISAQTAGDIKPEASGIKLVEYGEDEDEEDSDVETIHSIEDSKSKKPYYNGKPFWAV